TKVALESSLDEVQVSNRNLTSAASILRAEDITIKAYNKRDKQESRNTFKGKNIDKLTVAFSLAKNNIAEPGNREIYLRLIEPQGTVLFNAAAGSGQFELDGQEAKFTQKTQVIYSNSATPVQIVYDRPGDYDFKTGKYTVELYADGKQIGYKVFDVK
ncbi:MAG: hypothetical protein HC880_19340, partial [Bacteroidia bacterium]|nr:hypothetical protein [Bacteroidia bacterium]